MNVNQTQLRFCKDLYNEKIVRKVPPQYILDKIADEKLTGKFNVRKSNVCQSCYVAKSVNGSCNC
jgi:hypothetical protein